MAITYNEIHDTFNALKKTGDYLENRWDDIKMFFQGKSHFVFVGCGSSYSVAKSMAALCNMGAAKPSAAVAAGDVILHAQRYTNTFNGAAVVVISRSGRTSELLMALDALEAQGCDFSVASITCADNTPLGERSDLVLSTPWAFDESVCQTRCVTNFYFCAAFIYARLTDNRTVLDDLQHLLADGAEYITLAESLAKWVTEKPWTHVVVLADAELEGIAEEGSLVFKEVCQLPSNYYHLLDVRHGPMVLIGEETLVLAVIGASHKLEYDLLADIKKKGAEVIAYSNGSEELNGINISRFGRPLSHVASGIPFIILCQMVAYYKSKVTGADPDKPTGLDPWIALK